MRRLETHLTTFIILGLFFMCSPISLLCNSCLQSHCEELCLGWHLGLKIDRLSCQQSEEDVRNKIFLQRNFGGFIILLFHHNFPFESIHKLLFAKTRNPP